MPITRKYLSLDSIKETTRDNFRKLMGQYFYVNELGNMVFGEDIKKLGFPSDSSSPAPTVYADYQSANPLDPPRSIGFKRTTAPLGEPAHTRDDYYSEYGLYSVNLDTSRDSVGNTKTLYVNVSTTFEEYPTLSKFSEDLREIFKNPGLNDFFYEESFFYEKPQVTSTAIEVGAFYNFFDEVYENTSQTIPETALPNVHVLDFISDSEYRGGSSPTFLFADMQEHSTLFDSVSYSTYLSDYSYDYKSYLQQWSPSYSTLTSDQATILANRGKNIILPYSLRRDKLTVTPTKDYHKPIGESMLKMPFGVYLSIPVEKFVDIRHTSHPGGEVIFNVDQSLISRGKLWFEPTPPYGTINPYGIADSLSLWATHFASAVAPTAFVGENADAKQEFGFNDIQYYSSDEGVYDLLKVTPPLVDYVLSSPGQQIPNATSIKYNSVMKIVDESRDLSSGDDFDGESADFSFDLSDKLIIENALDSAGQSENIVLHNLESDYESAAASLSIQDYYSYEDHEARIHWSPTGFPSDIWSEYTLGRLASEINEDCSIGRSYKEIFEQSAMKAGDSFNQSVIYRIAKYKGEDTTTDPIQNIWLSNTEKQERLGYIDTQVKYGETYTYKISAYKYVFGTKYRYRAVTMPRVAQTTEEVEGEELLGYKIEYFGAPNLFDDFVKVSNWINAAGVENTYYYFAYWDAAYLGVEDVEDVELSALTTNATSFASYDNKNEKFFTIDDLREIMRSAWNIRPGAGSTESPSWNEIFGVPFNDEWFYEGMPVTPAMSDLRDGFRIASYSEAESRTGIYLAAAVPDLSNLSIQDWIDMFFGYSTEKSFSVGNRSQGVPPSHHILWLGTLAGAHTGFENGSESYLASTVEAGYWSDSYADFDDPSSDFSLIQEVEMREYTEITETGYDANYAIDMYSCPRIVEVPYLTISTSVISRPPLMPEVSFIPYRSVNDKLTINFNTRFGKEAHTPIYLLPSDEELFSKHYKSQNKFAGEMIEFKTDDTPSGYQIFRLSKPPNNYQDFEQSLRDSATTLVSSTEARPIRSTSTSYEDSLQPNTKYYYTFRTVDFHGNVSNPSIVYEVELVDDGGAVYPLINTYEFPVEEAFVPQKQMKKVMQIVPTLDQSVIDPSVIEGVLNPNDVESIRLGSPELLDTVWGKKFKIRLTSNDTGKKIDFNVNFDFVDDRPVYYEFDTTPAAVDPSGDPVVPGLGLGPGFSPPIPPPAYTPDPVATPEGGTAGSESITPGGFAGPGTKPGGSGTGY